VISEDALHSACSRGFLPFENTARFEVIKVKNPYHDPVAGRAESKSRNVANIREMCVVEFGQFVVLEFFAFVSNGAHHHQGLADIHDGGARIGLGTSEYDHGEASKEE
jgi:hypothetical protein